MPNDYLGFLSVVSEIDDHQGLRFPGTGISLLGRAGVRRVVLIARTSPMEALFRSRPRDLDGLIKLRKSI